MQMLPADAATQSKSTVQALPIVVVHRDEGRERVRMRLLSGVQRQTGDFSGCTL